MDKQNNQTPSLDNQLKNWAVEAMEPPPGVSSFSSMVTRRNGHIHRRNPQFEDESAPMTGLNKDAESKRAKSPKKLEKAKDRKGDDNAEPGTSIEATKDLSE